MPWTQEFLKARAEVYRRAAHPLAPHAESDWQEFLDNSSTPGTLIAVPAGHGQRAADPTNRRAAPRLTRR